MSERKPFLERLAGLVQARQSQVVVGLDPDPARLWPTEAESDGLGAAVSAQFADSSVAAVRAAAAVASHCEAVIDAIAPEAVAVKLQVACFERLGAPGWSALEQAVAHARAAGLLVIADAKRGDIDVSAHAYAQGLLGSTQTPFGEVTGLGADAVTASPYMGADTLEPFSTVARASGAGLFVLVRTSNPGAGDIEDLRAGSVPVWEHVAAMVDRLGADAVVGATRPEHIARMRELMPRAVFLMPGVGAQGGTVEALLPAFAPGPHFGLITASRSIVGAGDGSADRAAAARAEANRLRLSAWSLV